MSAPSPARAVGVSCCMAWDVVFRSSRSSSQQQQQQHQPAVMMAMEEVAAMAAFSFATPPRAATRGRTQGKFAFLSCEPLSQ